MEWFWYLSAQTPGQRERGGCASGKMGLWSVAFTMSAFKLNKPTRESAARSRGGEK